MAISAQSGNAPLPTNVAGASAVTSFITANPGTPEYSVASASALDAYGTVQTAKASRDKYRNIDTNISVRNQFGRSDYDYFRPGESTPQEYKDLIIDCMQAYRNVGIIRNIIDLMADFAAQGVRINHPNASTQQFLWAWFKKVKGPERTERALNYLYRCGQFVAKRHTAQLNKAQERKLRATAGKLDADTDYDNALTTSKRVIPVRYVYMNPAMLEVIGGELSQFVGEQLYAVKISRKLAKIIQYPKPEHVSLIAKLPADLIAQVKKGARLLPLHPDKIAVYHYKRDDWEQWADPIHFSILDDIKLYNKMKLADLSALDGAISQVRLWKLGDIEKGIFPTDAAVQKLADILLSNPGGGAFDLIWGPELTLEESKTTVHQFLGKAKYEPVMNAIYEGLGVPPTLTGSGDAGMTNNYVSLQTLVRRLEYGRTMVTGFWEQEIELVRQAMGFKKGAKVVFDHNVLGDEASSKALLLQLADRDVISVQTLAERFQEDPEFEQLKIKKENQMRVKGTMRPKAGQWHDPEKLYHYAMAAIPRGYMDPRHAGVEFDEDYVDLETPFEVQLAAQEKIAAMKPAPTAITKTGTSKTKGRPTGKKDGATVKRSRTPKPLSNTSKASDEQEMIMAIVDFYATLMWARQAQTRISDIVTPGILEFYDKKTQRGLAAEEVKTAERTKFAILAQFEPLTNVSEEMVAAVATESNRLDNTLSELFDALWDEWASRTQKEPTIEETRLIQATAYAAYNQ